MSVEMNEYQNQTNLTDQAADTDRVESLLIPVLGLSGRAGALSTEYLRHLRDGSAYVAFNQHIAETLGDILWYVSNISHKNGLRLSDIASGNLAKTKDRWERSSIGETPRHFEEGYPDSERFPKTFVIDVSSATRPDGISTLQLMYEGRALGDSLTDNAEDDDGYRFHDIFHIAFVTYLGWSPVFRGKLFFNCKRKSSLLTDEVEDGGRAAVIDEAVAALIFNEAKKNSFYDGVDNVSIQLLQLIKQMTSHLEVGCCSMAQWENGILNAFRVWRLVRAQPTGRILGDRLRQRLEYEPQG
jgi:hypothetical protein